ncbi:MAG TPA: protein-disulfide reductase DsbD domain-containing protein [Kofleriaceae bacterium]|nr:protein-disulfide reductase DsbD domain-containing protein [Kofleriaceae bacterium]
MRSQPYPKAGLAPALAVAAVAVAGVAGAIVLAGMGVTPAAAQSQKSAPPRAEDLVKLELIADTTHVGAGKKLTLAARFDIAPGWHIYWENPGEAGLATEAAFTAPAGYEVGPLRFPGPERFQTPGEGAVSFGYEKTAVLSSIVAAPARLAGEPVRFSVKASWLVCRDVCLRGKGQAALELPPAGRGQDRARPAHAELFDRHRAELPRAFAELRAAHRWERDAREARLVIAGLRADRVEYFPPSGEDLQLTGQGAAAAPGGAKGTTELRLRYKPGTKPARARGVLAVTRGAETRYYALDLEEAP